MSASELKAASHQFRTPFNRRYNTDQRRLVNGHWERAESRIETLRRMLGVVKAEEAEPTALFRLAHYHD